jgi:hypothetical protein
METIVRAATFHDCLVEVARATGRASGGARRPSGNCKKW